MKWKSVVAILGTAIIAFLTAGVPRPARASEPRVIEIHAKRFGFSPDMVTLKRGETVKIRLVSEDVTHGFFLRPLKIDEEVSPGQPTEITLTPDKSGTFTTICDHFCGANHGNMKMTIVVSE
ncbi:MAG TPA: cupredoxin domain-containing protein [Terriglobales bacterium]|nr:cupredoxin domain-containing protein [Terriglobales bacterium]